MIRSNHSWENGVQMLASSAIALDGEDNSDGVDDDDTYYEGNNAMIMMMMIVMT